VAKKIKMGHGSKFVIVWLAIFILILGVAVGKFVVLRGQAPSLQQVLTENELANSAAKSNHLSLFIVGLLAFSFATLSVAKSYEIVKRNKQSDSLPERINPFTVIENQDSNKRKESRAHEEEIENLKKNRENLLRESAEIGGRLKEITSELDEMKKVEQVLRKSNISLSKECERLKSENENYMLQLSSLKIKQPKKSSQGKITTKAKAKKPAKHKGVKRRIK
jgi:hypothetical protein